MTRLLEIRGPLDAVSALGGPMTRVRTCARASMLSPRCATHSIRCCSSNHDLPRLPIFRNRWRSSVHCANRWRQVGALAGPMSRLAALTSIVDRPMLLIAVALAALAAWGLLPPLAVRMAIVSARRSDPARQA